MEVNMLCAMLATITAYGVGKFIHVLAVVLAFGPTFAYPVFASVGQRLDPRSVPAILRGILKTDQIFVTPGMIVVLLAGIYTQTKGSLDASESWIGVGYLAILLLLAMSHAFFRPSTKRALETAERDLEVGPELSPEFEAIARRLSLGGQIASAIIVVTIFFMVVKP